MQLRNISSSYKPIQTINTLPVPVAAIGSPVPVGIFNHFSNSETSKPRKQLVHVWWDVISQNNMCHYVVDMCQQVCVQVLDAISCIIYSLTAHPLLSVCFYRTRIEPQGV